MMAQGREQPEAAVPRDTGIPAGVSTDASVRRLAMPSGEILELLVAPTTEADGAADAIDGHLQDRMASTLRQWVAAAPTAGLPPVVVPLYGCLVVQGTGRAAVTGPPECLVQLEVAVTQFSSVEWELRDIERHSLSLVDAVEAEAAFQHGHLPEHRTVLASRYHDAVSLGKRLALLAPAVHAAPVHPPTLASQLGDRLRERMRLAERHELARERVEFAERVADTCGQRGLETAVAKQQTSLEWAIVVLLVAQTSLLVVDLLARQGTP